MPSPLTAIDQYGLKGGLLCCASAKKLKGKKKPVTKKVQIWPGPTSDPEKGFFFILHGQKKCFYTLDLPVNVLFTSRRPG